MINENLGGKVPSTMTRVVHYDMCALRTEVN